MHTLATPGRIRDQGAPSGPVYRVLYLCCRGVTRWGLKGFGNYLRGCSSFEYHLPLLGFDWMHLDHQFHVMVGERGSLSVTGFLIQARVCLAISDGPCRGRQRGIFPWPNSGVNDLGVL